MGFPRPLCNTTAGPTQLPRPRWSLFQLEHQCHPCDCCLPHLTQLADLWDGVTQLSPLTFIF